MHGAGIRSRLPGCPFHQHGGGGRRGGTCPSCSALQGLLCWVLHPEGRTRLCNRTSKPVMLSTRGHSTVSLQLQGFAANKHTLQ